MDDLPIPGETPALPGLGNLLNDLPADQASRVGDYTAERIRERQPQLYRAAIRLYSSGLGVLRIADLLGMSHHTISAIVRDAPDAVAMAKQQVSRRAMLAASALLERIEEDIQSPEVMAETSLKDKAITMAVLTDKGLLTGGEATERIEVVSPDGQSFDQYIQGLRGTGAGGGSGPKGGRPSGRTGVDFVDLPEGPLDSGSGADSKDSKDSGGGGQD